jgi:hypothetical protein
MKKKVLKFAPLCLSHIGKRKRGVYGAVRGRVRRAGLFDA